ncbi:MAG: S1 RNA-binding domain-containing protein [Bacillota bacterium]
MIELGKIQELQVLRKTSIGVYLGTKDDKGDDGVLLPKSQIEQDVEIGDEIQVFVYRDSEDRLIATIKKPKLTIGEIALLKVVETTRIGAFLDWGLEKDLFLPFKEQTCSITKGKEYLIALYIDKSDRLCGTMDVYKLLSNQSPYKTNDKVQGTIYSMKEDMGAFVAVDQKYHGLIPKHELFGNISCGDTIEARVTQVREDGKLVLSVREKAYKQMDKDAVMILDKLKANHGVLYLNDKSSPQEIEGALKMSKNAFKRAVGRLLKEGKIKFSDHGIELTDK